MLPYRDDLKIRHHPHSDSVHDRYGQAYDVAADRLHDSTETGAGLLKGYLAWFRQKGFVYTTFHRAHIMQVFAGGYWILVARSKGRIDIQSNLPW